MPQSVWPQAGFASGSSDGDLKLSERIDTGEEGEEEEGEEEGEESEDERMML